MTETQEHNKAVHDRVSRAYREVAGERAPATLNESVMRQAQAATHRGYAHLLLWLRPLAWAATIGLSLAVVLQLADTPVPDSIDDAIAPSATPAALAEDKAATDRAESRAGKRQELNDAARTREMLMREKEAAVPQALPARTQKFTASEAAEPVFCAGDEVASPAAWLECIRSLAEDGRDDAAARERERLAAAFPDFPLPGD